MELERSPLTHRERIGLWLLAFSLLPFAAILALPFVPADYLPVARPTALAILLGLSEAFNLLGIAVAGPDLLRRLRERWRTFKSRWKKPAPEQELADDGLTSHPPLHRPMKPTNDPR